MASLLLSNKPMRTQKPIIKTKFNSLKLKTLQLVSFEQKSSFNTKLNLKRAGFLSPLSASSGDLSGIPTDPLMVSVTDCDYEDLSHLIVKVKGFKIGHVDKNSYSSCIPLSKYIDTIIRVEDLLIFMQRSGTDLPGLQIFRLNIDIDSTELKAIKNDPQTKESGTDSVLPGLINIRDIDLTELDEVNPQTNEPNEPDCGLYVFIPHKTTREKWMNVSSIKRPK